jgi:hypothetical protein
MVTIELKFSGKPWVQTWSISTKSIPTWYTLYTLYTPPGHIIWLTFSRSKIPTLYASLNVSSLVQLLESFKSMIMMVGCLCVGRSADRCYEIWIWRGVIKRIKTSNISHWCHGGWMACTVKVWRFIVLVLPEISKHDESEVEPLQVLQVSVCKSSAIGASHTKVTCSHTCVFN